MNCRIMLHFIGSSLFVKVPVEVFPNVAIFTELPVPRHPDKSVLLKIIFVISQPKHMLWAIKRTISMRRFF